MDDQPNGAQSAAACKSGTSTSWTVDGKKIAGLVFGPQDGIPVLALHGWLDNAASFQTLAPLLTDIRLVAIDMPGHGLSDHRSTDAGYQIWDDLAQLIGLIDQLGWNDCVLLGHSRGAMIATLLAAVHAETVKALITLDGLVTLPVEDRNVARQLRSFLKDRTRLSVKPKRIFSSKEEFVERRARSGEPPQIASQLAIRSLMQTEAGFEWRGDHRLNGASAIKLNIGQIEAILQSLEMPVFNIWATPSDRMKPFVELAQNSATKFIQDLTTALVPGHHHWHMEPDTAALIAEQIEAFLLTKAGFNLHRNQDT